VGDVRASARRLIQGANICRGCRRRQPSVATEPLIAAGAAGTAVSIICSKSPHLGTRQYARILGRWVEQLGLDPAEYGTHSMRRTKATLIYRRRRTCVQSSYCLVARRWSRPSAASGLKWTMHWSFPSKRRLRPASHNRQRGGLQSGDASSP